MSYIPYTRHSLDADDIEAVVAALKSDWLTQGPKVGEFERALAARVGARHAVAVANGTAALHCACLAADLKPGDEVITSPITFAASGNCALYVGAEVRFVDIRSDTYCLDPGRLKNAIGARTRAIIPVDFTGQPCDLDEIMQIARARGLLVISDAAHSLGGRYKGAPVGSLAHMTIFSFHGAKHVAMGEGGAIVTDDDNLAARLRLFRSHGITASPTTTDYSDAAADIEGKPAPKANELSPAAWYYEMQALGFNYRVTDIQCALGLTQLAKLDASLTRRAEIAAHYTRAFSASDRLTVPYVPPDRESAWHLYVLRLRLDRLKPSRREIFDELRGLGIGVHVHYIPLHLQPYYRARYGHRRGDFPVAEAFYDAALTIPLFPAMSDADCERVIQSVLTVLGP